MIRSAIFSLFLFATTISVVGCGPSNDAAFDPDAQVPLSAEEQQAEEDYNKKMIEEAGNYQG